MTTNTKNEKTAVRLRIVIDVEYKPTERPVSQIVEDLEIAVKSAIVDDGLLTTGILSIDSHQVAIKEAIGDMDEDDLTTLMSDRIESGDLAVEDIPNRLARYGLMDPVDFVNEMVERRSDLKSSP
jgi:hypothetical protein